MSSRKTMSDCHYVWETAVAPKAGADKAAFEHALTKLGAENPNIGIEADVEDGTPLLRTCSEDDLRRGIAKLGEMSAASFDVGAPHVVYREALSEPVAVVYTHKKQTGGAGQFAEVKIGFEPMPRDSGFVFVDEVPPGHIPKEYVRAVEKGVRAQKESGLLAGFPVIDFKARLIDGKYHEVDSNRLTFEIAARAAFREIAKKSRAILLWPILEMDIETPEDFFGAVVGDLNARSGAIRSCDTSQANGVIAINALVPAANIWGYETVLRDLTEGRARHTAKFSGYQPVPRFDGGDDPKFPAAAAMRVA